MLVNTADSTIVPIQGTFDIALARNTLRLKIARQRWSSVFNAQAATVLTAMGELILALGRSQPVVIRIATVEETRKGGIELSTSFQISDKKPTRWEERVQTLERAATELNYQEVGNEFEITAYIWVE